MRCKKLILSFIVCFVSFVSYGQLQRGVGYFGFDFNYSRTSTDYYYADGSAAPGAVDGYDFSLYPTAGIFLNEHFMIGLKMDWSKRKDYSSNSVFESDTDRKDLSAGPFCRYYKMLGEQFGFFAEAGVMFGKGESTTLSYDPWLGEYRPVTTDVSSFQAGIRPGIVFFLGKRIALESTIGFLGYENVENNFDDDYYSVTDTEYTNFGFSISPSTINLGLKYYLIKKSAE